MYGTTRCIVVSRHTSAHAGCARLGNVPLTTLQCRPECVICGGWVRERLHSVRPRWLVVAEASAVPAWVLQSCRCCCVPGVQRRCIVGLPVCQLVRGRPVKLLYV